MAHRGPSLQYVPAYVHTHGPAGSTTILRPNLANSGQLHKRHASYLSTLLNTTCAPRVVRALQDARCTSSWELSYTCDWHCHPKPGSPRLATAWSAGRAPPCSEDQHNTHTNTHMHMFVVTLPRVLHCTQPWCAPGICYSRVATSPTKGTAHKARIVCMEAYWRTCRVPYGCL